MSNRLNYLWVSGWNFVDERMLVRRLLLIGAAWLTYDSYEWCKRFALLSKWDALGTASVIASVAAPATLLLKFVLDNYVESRK